MNKLERSIPPRRRPGPTAAYVASQVDAIRCACPTDKPLLHELARRVRAGIIPPTWKAVVEAMPDAVLEFVCDLAPRDALGNPLLD